MADDRAIAVTSRTLRDVLRSAAEEALLPDTISIDVAQAADLQQPLGPGQGGKIWIYLHAVRADAVGRAGRSTAGAPVPALKLHYLVVPVAVWWSPGQFLLGLVTRALHEVPVLTAAMLNAPFPSDPVFADDERVELAWEPLSTADLAAIWAIAPERRQPAASYVARFVPQSAPSR